MTLTNHTLHLTSPSVDPLPLLFFLHKVQTHLESTMPNLSLVPPSLSHYSQCHGSPITTKPSPSFFLLFLFLLPLHSYSTSSSSSTSGQINSSSILVALLVISTNGGQCSVEDNDGA